MVTIKSYTDLEQSKMLAEILPIDSADMWWAERYNGYTTMDYQYVVEETPYYYLSLKKPSIDNYSQDTIKDIPCWSLAALLSLLPNNEHIGTTISRGSWKIDTIEYLPNTWWCEYEDNESLTEFNTSADNPVDACVAMIEKLNELNLLWL